MTKEILDILFSILIVVWLFCNVFLSFCITVKSNKIHKSNLKIMFDLYQEKTKNCNWFGYVMVIIMLIGCIPAILLEICVEFICLIGKFIGILWKLGQKKETRKE